MTIQTVLAYAFGLFLLYIIGMLLVIPIKIIFKFIMNGILGALLLFIVNIIGGFVNFTIPINPVNAIVTGFLGIPGVILLIILQKIL